MADWHENLPEDLKTEPSLLKYETQEEAFKGLVQANASLATSIRIPGPDATAEVRSEFIEKIVKNSNGTLIRRPEAEDEVAMAEYRQTMGIPDDTAEYTNPEDFQGLDDTVLVEMQKVAKKAGLTKRQYQDMIVEMASMDAQGQEAAQAATAAEDSALKAEWGLAHDERIAMTDRLMQQFAPEYAGPVNAEMRKLMFALGQSMSGQGPQAHFQPQTPTQQISPEEANEQIAELRSRMNDPSHRGEYKTMMARMAKLQKLAHPSAA